MNALRKHLSYANVVATLALLFAMSGGALAASHYLINSTKQINPKVLRKLAGKTGKTGPPGPQGPQGATGLQGAEGKEGPAATHLWASVLAEPSGAAKVGAGSGVSSVEHVGTGLTKVTFDRDVSHCSFQATLVDPAGGLYDPPTEINVFTGFYEDSGLTDAQVVVSTLHSQASTNGYSFAIAAFC
jgi:hypothetical protein